MSKTDETYNELTRLLIKFGDKYGKNIPIRGKTREERLKSFAEALDKAYDVKFEIEAIAAAKKFEAERAAGTLELVSAEELLRDLEGDNV